MQMHKKPKTHKHLPKLVLQPLALLLTLLSNNCAQLPPVPRGTLFIDNQATQQMVGQSIESAVNGTSSPPVYVPMNQTNGYVCFDPQVSWPNIQAYIQELTQVAKRQCSQ